MNPTWRNVVRVFLMACVVIGVAAPAYGAGPASLPPQAPQVVPPPAPTIIVWADPGVSDLHIPPPAGFSALGARSATIIVNYIPGGQQDVFGTLCYTWPEEAKSAFSYAASVWATLVTSPVPIVINACWATLRPGVLGYGAAGGYARDFQGAPQSGTWYPIALVNALSGMDTNGERAEMHLAYSKNFSWYYGTDGNTPSTQYDFASVVLHEICHGLGFAGSMIVSGGQGSWGWGEDSHPAIYDRFTENGAGQALLSFPNNSTLLAGQLTGGNLYFNGPNANAAAGGGRPKLYAPPTWQQGSSYSHLDEIYNGTENTLMTYSIPKGESTHAPGPIALGVLKDVGWNAGAPPPSLTTITPNSGANTGPVHVTLAGSNFQTSGTTTVRLTRSGQPDLTATNVSVVSSSQIACDFDLTGAAAGPWSVVVTNPDGQAGTLVDGFTVKVPPTVTYLTPDRGANAGSVHVSVIGNHLQPSGTTTVRLTRPGYPDIAATGVNVSSVSRLTCDFNLVGATPGWWNVQVTNPDGLTTSLPSAFFVIDSLLPNLAVSAAALQSRPEPGSRLTYTIALKNNSSVTATDVVFTDTLAGGTTFVSLTPACEGGTLTLPGGFACRVQGGTLTLGGGVTYMLVVTLPANARGQLVNGVVVVGAQADGDPSDNSSRAMIYIGPTIFLPTVLK